MKHLRLWMALFVVLGGALLFACSDDGDDNGDDNGQPTAEETMDDGAEPTASDSNGDGGSTNDELLELAAGLADKEAKIVYDFTSTGADADGSGSFTLYWKPPSSWRIDIDTEGQVATLISKDGISYLCADDGSGGGSCFASPVGLPLPFLNYFTNPDELTNLIDTELSGVDFDESSDSIAGQDVTCFSAEGTVEGETGSGQYCFTDDGVLMRIRGESGGVTFSLEASSVEDSVADADLELPYDILEIPVT